MPGLGILPGKMYNLREIPGGGEGQIEKGVVCDQLPGMIQEEALPTDRHIPSTSRIVHIWTRFIFARDIPN
jgi:hypothetical protein